jgi:hypothetical protein
MKIARYYETMFFLFFFFIFFSYRSPVYASNTESTKIDNFGLESLFCAKLDTAITCTEQLETIKKMQETAELLYMNINLQLERAQKYLSWQKIEKENPQLYISSHRQIMHDMSKTLQHIMSLEEQRNKINDRRQTLGCKYSDLLESHGANPLYTLIENWLLKYPSWINKRIGPQKTSLLHLMCIHGNHDSILHLLGIDSTIINLEQGDGLRPLDIAFLKNNTKIYDLLRTYKAQLNTRFQKTIMYINALKQFPPNLYDILPQAYKTWINTPIEDLLRNMHHFPQQYGDLDQRLENYYKLLHQKYPQKIQEPSFFLQNINF